MLNNQQTPYGRGTGVRFVHAQDDGNLPRKP